MVADNCINMRPRKYGTCGKQVLGQAGMVLNDPGTLHSLTNGSGGVLAHGGI